MYHCVNAAKDKGWMAGRQINGSVHNISKERPEEARAHEVHNLLIQYVCNIGLAKDAERLKLASSASVIPELS